jgi:prevent-host-death family protein
MEISVAQIRDHLADAINRVAYAGERVVLQRRGKGVAALVSMEDLARLKALEDTEDARLARQTLTQMKSKRQRPIPLAAVKKRLGM